MGFFKIAGKMLKGDKAGVARDICVKNVSDIRARVTSDQWNFLVDHASAEINAFIIGHIDMHFVLNRIDSDVFDSFKIVSQELGLRGDLKDVEEVLVFHRMGMRYSQSAKKMKLRGTSIPTDFTNLQDGDMGVHDIADWWVGFIEEISK